MHSELVDEDVEMKDHPSAGGWRGPLRPLGLVEAVLAKVPEIIWTASVVVSYLLIITPILARHVLWRDEAQMWLVARASDNFSALLANMSYENRPILWFLVVWPIARLSSNPEAMKLLNLLAATASAFVITRWLPMFRLEQLALLGGFLFVMGYSSVTQGYMLGTALLIIWAAAYSRHMVKSQMIIAGLMASVHVLFAAVAVPLIVVTALEWAKAARGAPARERLLTLVAGGLGMLLVVVNLLLVIPPKDYWFRQTTGVSLVERMQDPAVFVEAMHYLSGAILAPGVALPSILAATPWDVLVIPVSLVFIVGLMRAGLTLVAPGVGLVVIVGNGVLGYGPYWWHSGPVILVLVLAVVMTRVRTGSPWTQGSLLWQSAALWLVLAFQLVASISYPGNTLWGSTPYSGAKEAAAIVEAACPAGCPLVTDVNYRAAAVSAYLGGESMYQLNGKLDGTFTVWTRRNLESGEVTWESLAAALDRRGEEAIAVLSELRNPPPSIEVIGETHGAVRSDEDFLVVRRSSN